MESSRRRRLRLVEAKRLKLLVLVVMKPKDMEQVKEKTESSMEMGDQVGLDEYEVGIGKSRGQWKVNFASQKRNR